MKFWGMQTNEDLSYEKEKLKHALQWSISKKGKILAK